MLEKIKSVFLFVICMVAVFLVSSLYWTQQGRELLDKNRSCTIKSFQHIPGENKILSFPSGNNEPSIYVLDTIRSKRDGVDEYVLMK